MINIPYQVKWCTFKERNSVIFVCLPFPIRVNSERKEFAPRETC